MWLFKVEIWHGVARVSGIVAGVGGQDMVVNAISSARFIHSFNEPMVPR